MASRYFTLGKVIAYLTLLVAIKVEITTGKTSTSTRSAINEPDNSPPIETVGKALVGVGIDLSQLLTVNHKMGKEKGKEEFFSKGEEVSRDYITRRVRLAKSCELGPQTVRTDIDSYGVTSVFKLSEYGDLSEANLGGIIEKPFTLQAEVNFKGAKYTVYDFDKAALSDDQKQSLETEVSREDPVSLSFLLSLREAAGQLCTEKFMTFIKDLKTVPQMKLPSAFRLDAKAQALADKLSGTKQTAKLIPPNSKNVLLNMTINNEGVEEGLKIMVKKDEQSVLSIEATIVE